MSQRRSLRNQDAASAKALCYDTSYHPLDDEFRPKYAQRRRQVHAFAESFDGERVSLQDHSPTISDSASSEKRPPQGTRASPRIATQSTVLYDTQRHPQDQELADAGIIRRRMREKTGAESETSTFAKDKTAKSRNQSKTHHERLEEYAIGSQAAWSPSADSRRAPDYDSESDPDYDWELRDEHEVYIEPPTATLLHASTTEAQRSSKCRSDMHKDRVSSIFRT